MRLRRLHYTYIEGGIVAVNAYSALWFRLFMPLQSEEMTQKEVAFLARQLPLPRYQRVLDLCCGYGRHALGLAARGYTVTGLDRDTEAIAEAERRADAAGLAISYRIGDMRQVGETPGEFDAVVTMWQSLGYFDDATNADVLRQIHDKLTPGGRFIADLYNRAFFERNQGEKRQEIDGVIVESRNYMEGARYHTVLTYRDGNGAVVGGDHFDWRVYTPEEFTDLASASGYTMRLICTWAAEDRPPSAEIARMQVVLERAR